MMWASDLFLYLVVPNQQKEIPACTRTLRYNVSFMIPTSACRFIDYMQCSAAKKIQPSA